jgi:hypothetical protein
MNCSIAEHGAYQRVTSPARRLPSFEHRTGLRYPINEPRGMNHARTFARLRMPEQGATMAAEKNDLRDETGAMGYILLWILGVPASILFVIFLLRGCT